MHYQLDELARLAAELELPSRRVDAHRLDIVVDDGCVLTFCNLQDDAETLVGFDGTPWHAHGRVVFATGEDTYVEYDELELLTALGTGALVVISEYTDGQLRDRWLAHRQAPLDLRHMQPGEELRVFRVRVGTAAASEGGEPFPTGRPLG